MTLSTTPEHEEVRRRISSLARTQRALRSEFLSRPSLSSHTSYAARVQGSQSEYGLGKANVDGPSRGNYFRGPDLCRVQENPPCRRFDQLLPDSLPPAEDITQLRVMFESMGDRHARERDHWAEVEARLMAEIGALNAWGKGLEKRCRELDGQVVTLGRRLADPPERSIGPLGERCEELEKEVSKLRAKLRGMTSRTVTAEEKKRIARIYQDFHTRGGPSGDDQRDRVLETLASGSCADGSIGPLGIALIEEAHEECVRLQSRVDEAERERANLAHDLIAVVTAISAANQIDGECDLRPVFRSRVGGKLSLGDAMDSLASLHEAYLRSGPEGNARGAIDWARESEKRHEEKMRARELDVENARLRADLDACRSHSSSLLEQVPGLQSRVRSLESQLEKERKVNVSLREQVESAVAEKERVTEERERDLENFNASVDSLRSELREAKERYEDALRVPVSKQRKSKGKKVVQRDAWKNYY